MEQLIWTKTKPNKPGWYWLRDISGDEIIAQIVIHHSNLVVDSGDGAYMPMQFFIESQWAGPIPQPKERAE